MFTARRRRSLLVGVSALAMAATGVLVADAATPPPAHLANKVGLKQVGPIDETNGFPLWYKDTNNVRLELCLDPNDAYCIMGDRPDMQAAGVLPRTTSPTRRSGRSPLLPRRGWWRKALLVTAVEAAFGSADGLPAKGPAGQFGRIRAPGRPGWWTAPTTRSPTRTASTPSPPRPVPSRGSSHRGHRFTDTRRRVRPDPRQPPGAVPQVDRRALAGYLGDPAVEHAVTGSPYNTNIFRIEGPAGSFTGSTQLCANAALGNSPTATDDCIESDQFSVQGKLATRAGVQVTRAYYANSGTGHMMDLFAMSEPGQNLVVSGAGIPQTKMRESAGSGRYYARVFADGAPPSDLAVTNRSDSPSPSTTSTRRCSATGCTSPARPTTTTTVR